MSEFMSLVNTSYPKVYYHCIKQTRNNHDAADITQNTFLKAFMHFSKLREPSSYEPWLFTICNNEIKQFYRNTKKTDLLQEPQHDEAHDTLYSAIDNLSKVQRQVVLLKYFGGYTIQELALVLSLSTATVKSRLYEARKTLKRFLNSPTLSPSLQKERRNTLMETINLCEVGAKTITSMSLHAQKQLLQCAKDNEKFSGAILAELANISSGQAFMEACNGKLSYDELLRILACCDDAFLYRLGGSTFKTWRNATDNPLVKDITALYQTVGYIDSVEPVIDVPSLRDTCAWYKKYLNWGVDADDEDNEKWGHAVISPYAPEGNFNSYTYFKGFHLRSGGKGTIANCSFFVFVSGLEDVRTDIIERGLDKVSEICHNAWGTRSFSITDLNGLQLEFCEWECK